MGEAAPFDDFSLTHGLCPACTGKSSAQLAAQVEPARRVADLYGDMRQAALSGRSLSVEDLLVRSESLGLKDVDLCVGILQPILQEIGILWSKGQVTIAREHQFTAFADAVIKRLKRAASASAPSWAAPDAVDALLVCADGNQHTVGLEIIDMTMTNLGLKTRVFVPGLPNAEILGLVRQLRPRILGISLSLLEQVRHVRQIAQAVANDRQLDGLKIVVGGGGVRSDAGLFAGLPSVRVAPNDIASLKDWLLAEVTAMNRAG